MAICNFNYRSDRIYLPGYSGTDLRAVKRNDTVCSRGYMRYVRDILFCGGTDHDSAGKTV
jgi:hypothetical protein